jgi:DNA excision repair protein ERCC-4
MSNEVIRAPFKILIDYREKLPYTFQGIRADARDDHRLIEITTEWQTLETGDYTIQGYEQRIAVERKGLEDGFSTFGKGRERFQKELRRLAAFESATVIIEAGWDEILNRPPDWSKLPPKIVYRSIIAWQQQFPAIHWWCVPGRRLAEITTFRIFSRYWRRYHES